MEIFSALLAICMGNSPVPGEFPTQRPVTRSFDVYFDLSPKRLSKQLWGWWFETQSRPLWRHRNGTKLSICFVRIGGKERPCVECHQYEKTRVRGRTKFQNLQRGWPRRFCRICFYNISEKPTDNKSTSDLMMVSWNRSHYRPQMIIQLFDTELHHEDKKRNIPRDRSIQQYYRYITEQRQTWRCYHHI